jgi:hypothetical protein
MVIPADGRLRPAADLHCQREAVVGGVLSNIAACGSAAAVPSQTRSGAFETSMPTYRCRCRRGIGITPSDRLA